MSGKTRRKEPGKCKAPPRPWLPALIVDALQTGDLPGACARAKVTLYELYRLRATSPEADAALAEVDQVVRLRAVGAVEAMAASGNLRAIRALTDGSLRTLLPQICADQADRPQPARGWTRCPNCQEPVFVWGRSGAGGLTVHLAEPGEAPTRDLATAPEYVQAWVTALAAGEGWAEEVRRFRRWERANIAQRWQRFRAANGEPQ